VKKKYVEKKRKVKKVKKVKKVRKKKAVILMGHGPHKTWPGFALALELLSVSHTRCPVSEPTSRSVDQSVSRSVGQSPRSQCHPFIMLTSSQSLRSNFARKSCHASQVRACLLFPCLSRFRACVALRLGGRGRGRRRWDGPARSLTRRLTTTFAFDSAFRGGLPRRRLCRCVLWRRSHMGVCGTSARGRRACRWMSWSVRRMSCSTGGAVGCL